MADHPRLSIGQKVRVEWPNGDTLADAILHHVPCNTGESWVFEDFKGFIYYVTEGITVSGKPEEAPDAHA